MRYCYYCKKPMFTSNHSIWIKGKNYDAHKACIKKNLKTMSLKKLFIDTDKLVTEIDNKTKVKGK